jgi:Leucine-rich repeat (LRR) protein
MFARRPSALRLSVLLSALISCALLESAARAAPNVDETMECMLAVLGEPGTNDECEVTVVTDKSKAEIEKKPHATFRLKIKASATNAELASLAKLPWLEQLSFESNNDNIDDLSALKALKKLRKLEAGELYKLKSLAFVSSLPELEELGLWGYQHDDLKPLSGLKKLRKLTLPQDAKDASAIVDLTGLNELSATGLDRLGPLSKLTRLEYLRASPDEDTSLAALAGMTNMKTLRLTGSKKLVDVSALKGMTALESLEIGMTAVSDISALAGATKLRYLDVNESKVSSIAALAKLTALEQVYLQQTAVKDFSPLLASAKTLKHLSVPDGTKKAQVAALLKTNPKIEIPGLDK